MRFIVIDKCPVPAEIAQQVLTLKHDVPTAVLQSAYRGDEAAGLLKRLGKSTQAMLYRGWLKRLPGFNPANPPGRSTHELRSDGTAYRGPIGRPIRAWGCGLDWNNAAVPKLIAAARRHGWELFQPYKSGSEYHHLNFRRRPRPPKRKKKVEPTRVSKAGVAFVASYESFRAKPYKDAVGVWTIGFGHTRGVSAKTPTIARDGALILLREEINRVYAPPLVRALKATGLHLSQAQFDALVSAVYNLGPAVLDPGRTLGDALRSRSGLKVANALLVYDKAGGKTLAGLTRRRRSERALFLSGSSLKTRLAARR